MNYIYITRASVPFHGWRVKAHVDGHELKSVLYMDYSRREAERLYRRDNNIKGRHLVKI